MPAPYSPSISVVIPTYEQAPFIGRALDSLQAQVLFDWEAIVIDDGSRDATTEVVSTYLSDTRIRYYQLAENQGLGRALNEGVIKAKAPLIAYLPSDDVYYRAHLGSLKTRLDTETGAVLAVKSTEGGEIAYRAGPSLCPGLAHLQSSAADHTLCHNCSSLYGTFVQVCYIELSIFLHANCSLAQIVQEKPCPTIR